MDSIQEILKTVKMNNSNKIKQDLKQLLKKYEDFSLYSAQLQKNGQVIPCVASGGPLKIHHQGSTLPIPVQLFFSPDYPKVSPVIYITIPPDMIFVSNEHVRGDGRVQVPSLKNWTNNSKLINILKEMEIQREIEKGNLIDLDNLDDIEDLINENENENKNENQNQNQNQNLNQNLNQNQNQNQNPNKKTIPKSVLKKKLKKKILKNLSSIDQEINNLNRELGELESKKFSLQKEFNTISEKYEKKLEQEEKAKKVIAKNEKRISHLIKKKEEEEANFNIDEATKSNDIPFEQLQELQAKQQTIEDTIFFLDYFLKNGKIDFQDYLKHLRSISRSLYLKQMHAKKIKKSIVETQLN
ncbi:tumor suppressor protein [Anaeramoeba ignava]|uniref:Tumor suppressor protein n=1 Tax=Anaeramoeba ignava TaxID=1746090 RepID=A0A9Q0LU35_ANAIG|nr:tumor suppressor protein [Anaeramoeba ignava]